MLGFHSEMTVWKKSHILCVISNRETCAHWTPVSCCICDSTFTVRRSYNYPCSRISCRWSRSKWSWWLPPVKVEVAEERWMRTIKTETELLPTLHNGTARRGGGVISFTFIRVGN
ncbi:hypothetical protein J6590_000861 [Homalodisca vitripennis]|nr:hypothetical protein J6590_000861 [Homalodisca vitripennis]